MRRYVDGSATFASKRQLCDRAQRRLPRLTLLFGAMRCITVMGFRMSHSLELSTECSSESRLANMERRVGPPLSQENGDGRRVPNFRRLAQWSTIVAQILRLRTP